MIWAVVCEEVDSMNYQIDSFHDFVDMFWISAIINYGVVFMLNIMYVVALCSAGKWVFNSRSHILGHLHQFNCFGFLNFLVFWTSVLLLLTCAGYDCSHLPQPWKDLSKGLAGVCFGLSYIFMVIEALFAEKQIFLDDEATTNEEAMNILEQKLLEPSPVEWVVECGHVVQRGI